MSRNAFTVIELIIVITVLGTLVLLGYPKLAGTLEKQDVRSARDVVAQMHSRARQNAISRGTRTTLRLQSGDLLITAAHPVTGALDTVTTPRDVVGDYGVAYTTSRDSLIFDPRGMGIEGSSTVIVVSKAGYSDSVEISAIGRLRK